MKVADLIVSPGPHRHSGASKTRQPYNILLALIPAAVLGIAFYGFDAARVIGISVAAAMLAEASSRKLFRRPAAGADGTAAVSGLLLALILPASTPWYMIVVANFLGIIVGKECFGGLGANPLNPALVGWATVRITGAWAGHLDFDLALINYQPGFAMQYPLAVVKAQGAAALGGFDRWDLFLGRQVGGIGAAAILWVLLGGLYLILRGLIPWRIPAGFLSGVIVTSGVFWLANGSVYADPIFHLVTGNVMIGAFFLATDSASSPVNRWPMLIFGFGCGLLTIIFRAWSSYPDGVVFACLLMSLCVPLLDRLTTKQVLAPRANAPATRTATGEGAGS
jgi:electron transport complex protein RnfD